MDIGGISIWQLITILLLIWLAIRLIRKNRKKKKLRRKITTPKNSDSIRKVGHTEDGSSPIEMDGSGTLKGWIYVATMENTLGVVRIGCSERDPQQRIEEWSTGQPEEVRLAYAVLVENPQEFESRVHKKLQEFRTQGEWFECDLSTAVTAIHESGTLLYPHDRNS